MSALELEQVTKAWPPLSRAVRVPHTEGEYRELVELLVLHVEKNPGKTNAEIAIALGLESSFEGRQRNYLSFSLLCDAVSDGRLDRKKVGQNIQYFTTAKLEK